MTVTAERRWGAGVEGVGLILFTGTRHLGFAETDGEGQARFDFVPFGVMGVSASMPEGFRPKDPVGGDTRTFRIGYGGSDSVTFTVLREAPGDLEVRVEDPQGAAVEGVRLELFAPDGVVAAFESDATGERRFSDLPFGEYGVRALPGPGYQVEGAIAEVDGLVVEGDWLERTILVLERCIGSIRVETVRDDGASLADVPVTLYTSDGEVDTARTDGAGVAAFPGLFCGDYGVRTAGRAGYALVTPATGFVDGLLVGHQEERIARFTFRRR
ncbi:MAG: carboxypeptidase regulatory-like domain-containing protein [Gemmatimonadales bacterium]|nr:MAG: carboxypeptidase regulatory-like domain-containing protein [Gemmatimonadales bacterium]